MCKQNVDRPFGVEGDDYRCSKDCEAYLGVLLQRGIGNGLVYLKSATWRYHTSISGKCRNWAMSEGQFFIYAEAKLHYIQKRVCLRYALVNSALHCPVAERVTGAPREEPASMAFVIPVIISIKKLSARPHHQQ